MPCVMRPLPIHRRLARRHVDATTWAKHVERKRGHMRNKKPGSVLDVLDAQQRGIWIAFTETYDREGLQVRCESVCDR
eukprot:COSAG02_NODE_1007_length_15239_cov_44.317503_2_plen_78_part_00